MYRLMVKDTFSAAHFLPGYDGNCSKLHGHNWKVEVFFESDFTLDGMCVDFKEIKNRLKDVLKEFNHTNLNEHREFKSLPPTCENIALYIFENMNNVRDDKSGEVVGDYVWKSLSHNANISSVRVWESENSYAEFIGE